MGRTCQIYLLLSSIWGFIFLGILGIGFYYRVVTLVGDVYQKVRPGDLHNRTHKEIIAIIDEKYGECAVQCFRAAVAFLVTFIIVLAKSLWRSVPMPFTNGSDYHHLTT
uniref:Uncharacterized protein n=1 Tax=Plectus sambesii TaxID=2011161 RepID=A0A914WSL0_9BILA